MHYVSFWTLAVASLVYSLGCDRRDTIRLVGNIMAATSFVFQLSPSLDEIVNWLRQFQEFLPTEYSASPEGPSLRAMPLLYREALHEEVPENRRSGKGGEAACGEAELLTPDNSVKYASAWLPVAARPASAMPEDFYATLGLSPAASIEAEALKAAYRKKALEVHPDKCVQYEPAECQARFIQVSDAYETLRKPSGARAYYEKWSASRGKRSQSRPRRTESRSRNSAAFQSASESWNRFAEENRHRWADLDATYLRMHQQVDSISRKVKQMSKNVQEQMESMQQSMEQSFSQMAKDMDSHFDDISRKIDEMGQSLGARTRKRKQTAERHARPRLKPLELCPEAFESNPVLVAFNGQSSSAKMVKFSRDASNPSKACKAQGVDLRVHYKNTYETAQAIKGMTLAKAKQYLEDVCEKKRCIPFRKYVGTIGRTPQAKEFKATQGRWPVKSAKIVLGLLKNAEANAEFKNLSTENLYVYHVQVNAAQQGRRRTYRAHGRIGPYMNCPCHVEMILQEKDEAVEKPAEEKQPKKFTRKQLAKLRLPVGGDK
ncbi:Rpl17 [Symbiodinium natans]|uniref:Rpl17 protein n=1 Tax=Symbiodinium natans TaxID=878477 RepID=A0A812LI00_9DINO|nr:Rpl17 [Symbiodinium natans]